MVTVDDATYVKMKDTLYGGDAGAASKAKAQIESSYTQQQYDNLISKLGNMGTTQQPTTPKPSNMDAGSSTIQRTTTPSRSTETPVKQQETTGSTVPEIQQQGELKPLSQDYYNQTSDDAQSKIINNLNNYRQTNPEYFRDYESFKKNFSYDARNDEQKQTLDSWYGGYQKGMELAGVPVTDLYTQYKDGQVSMNELENLRIYDPTKYAELQNQINKGNIIAAYDDDKGEDTTGMSIQDMAYNMAVQTFTKFMSGEGASEASQFFRDYEEKMESPEMLALSDQCTEVQEQMENIQSDLDSIKKQVEAEYEGTGATRSKINAIIADRSYDLQLQLRTLNSEYNKYATQYNNRMQQYQNEFSMQLQEYQFNQQARNQQMNELGFAMDLMNFETNEQKQQREWDYWVKQQEYTNGNINSKDYDTRYKAALKSVQNLLSQYEGIPMQRSAEQMAQDILKAIDGGSDLGAELTKINQQIQGKKEYKMLYNQTFKNPDAGITGSYTIGDQQYVVYNGKLMPANEFNSRFGVNADGKATTYGGTEYTPVNSWNMQSSFSEFMNGKTTGQTGGQCGKFVNDYLQSIGLGRLVGNSVSSKTNLVNTDPTDVGNLSIGSIAVFDYSDVGSVSENARKYGHVGIVAEIDEAGGRVRLVESNLRGDEKITTSRWINVKNPAQSLKGFFDPSKGSVSVETAGDNNSFVSGSIEGVPLAYERAVKNLVPAALQNSDAEREALNTIITNSYKGGIDQSEIALKFMGFDIRNDSDKALATDLVNTVRTLSTDTQEGIVQTISDMMNQGNYYKAIQTVENAVTKQAKEAGNYSVSESAVKNTINKSNELANYVSGLKNSPIGVVEGNMQEWLNSYASKDAKKIANLTALVEASLDIKDKETLQRIVPQLTDQPSVFMSKLENLNNSLMAELNGWRNIYGLPNLTTEALADPTKRVDLYKNGGSTQQSNNQTTQTQSTTTTSSVGWTPSWHSTLPQTTTGNIKTITTNVGGYYVPTNFYQQ